MTINGGTFNRTGKAQPILTSSGGEIIVNGGTFDNSVGPIAYAQRGTLTINNGSFTGVYNHGSGLLISNNMLNINGGIFKAKQNHSVVLYFYTNGEVNLTGGTFENGILTNDHSSVGSDKHHYLRGTLADGYAFYKNDESVTMTDDQRVINGTVMVKKAPVYYTVTYNTDGGTLTGDGIQTVTENQQYKAQYLQGASTTLPTTVTRVGYEFAGWYSSVDDRYLDSIGEDNTLNREVTAHWNRLITDADITLGNNPTYTGEGQTITITSVTLDGKTLMLGTDYEIVSGNKGTNADDYTLTIQGKGGYNGTATKGWTILKADQTAPTVGKTDETIRGKADGTISSLTTAMEYRAKNSQTYTKAQTDGTLKNLAAGTYYVRYAETDNYKASEDAVVAIGEGRLLTITLPVENEQVGYTLTANSTQVRYNDGTVIRIVLDSGYTRGDSFRVTATNGTVTLVGGAYYLQNVTEDTVVTVEGIVDSTAPTAEITVKGNSWSKFVDKITFGLFFNETQDVTITANDAGSGVDRIYYYLSDTPLTLEQVKALADTNWTEYAGKFSISAEQKYVVYAKVTDNWGNATYISSDGLILDMTAPVISGVENGKTYYTTQKVTANDTNLKELTLDGVAFDGTIPGNVDKVYTITAKDKAGNSTTFSITMKPISSIREGLPTMDTVKISDKDAIEDVRATASNVLASQCANATDEEKNQLEQIITDCDTLLEAIQNAEDAIELIAAMPDAKKTQPDDKTAIDAYEAAKAAYDKLTDAEKRMVGNENKAKLDAMYEALTAYDITKGDGSTWTKGSTSGLSFTANGYFGKFTGIKVDGETVDAKYYEAQSGSTVITLKASYLQTLKTGKHTIQVVYTDGATDGTDTFTIKAAGTTGGNSTTNGVNSPATGDHSHMALWISLLCVSAVGMIAVLLVRRKKGRYER